MSNIIQRLGPNRSALFGWFIIAFGFIWIVKGGIFMENPNTLTIGIGF